MVTVGAGAERGVLFQVVHYPNFENVEFVCSTLKLLFAPTPEAFPIFIGFILISFLYA